MATSGQQRVMVAVRVRPILRDGISAMHQAEKFELQGVYRVSDTAVKCEVTKPGEPAKSSLFNFDYIFDQESTQLELYEDAVVDMVDAALVGVNGTLLAYGQTGSGKTFSILGDVKPNPLENDLLTTDSGMFLRVLSDLMDFKIRQKKKGWHVVVGLNCVEIYNEQVRDLFGGTPKSDPPPIKAKMIGDEVLMPNLIVREMTSLQAVFNEIQLAISRRSQRETDANATSSRSHCLFSIDIMQQHAGAPAPSLDLLDPLKNKAGAAGSADPTTPSKKHRGNAVSPTTKKAPETLPEYEMPFQGTVLRVPGQKEPVYCSKIILADLAGSERIAKTGVKGQGLVEATSINGSLTSLGNVVHSLHEGSFPSYRDSQLTSLLKPTFAHPSSRVLLLAQVAPTQLTFDETVSTMHFANKVKAMKVTTTTGAEAEKLQFDYIETEKTYDSLMSDLHIFAVEHYARAGVIRRHLRQNDGLFYNAAAAKTGGKKVLLKDRKPAVEALGAFTVAERERDENRARMEREREEEEARRRQQERDATQAEVAAHAENMREAREGVDSEVERRRSHRLQMLIGESAARGTQVMEEEACEWAALERAFLEQHTAQCAAELERATATYDSVSQEANKMRLESRPDDIPEVVEDNKAYALHTWGHCTARRFFASCMELREEQMLLLAIAKGNAALQKWADENREAIEKFQRENGGSGAVAEDAVAA